MKTAKRILGAVLLLLLLLAALAFYCFRVEPYRLTVTEHALTARGGGGTGSFTVVQFSDIELSADYTEKELPRIAEMVNARQPDIIVFTGDLFSNYGRYAPEDAAVAALAEMEAPLGKFAVWGNNDHGGGADWRYEEIVTRAGFTLLCNESLTLPLFGGKRLWLGGVDDSLLGSPDILGTMQGNPEEADYRILLAHEPDTAEALEEGAVDLILSGHSHGGQINLPFIRERVAGTQYISGFYPFGPEMQLYVNRGLGTSRVPARLFAPPEISVFHISI